MFNLFRSRDRLIRIMLTAILLVVAASMVTYLIPSYGNTDRGPDSVLAEVGKDTITMHEVQLKIQDAIRAQRMPTDMVSLYLPQLIEDLVTYHALIYEAHRLGLQVTDAETSSTIRAAIPNLFPDGKFVGREAYAAFVGQQNMTIPEFEADMANRILVTRLTDIVLEGTLVTPAEIEQEYHRRNDKIKVEYVKISPAQFKSDVKVTPAEIKAYYDKNRAQFPIPEKRSLAVVMLDQGRIEQSLQPPDADLRRMYDSEKDSFRNPERVLTRHILFKAGKTPEEDAKIKAKAEDVLKQLKAGADFAELAKKYSEDRGPDGRSGSAARGGDLGWLVRGQTVKPFEDTAFSLKPKEISDLVKTQFGYHIIQVLDHQQAHLQTFEEARAQLVDEWRKQRASQMIEDLADRAEAGLKKDPPDKVAKDLNLAPPIVADNLAPGQPVPGIGANNDFQQAIKGLQKGEVSPPVPLPGNRVALAVVTAVVPTHPATLEEAEKQIEPMLESAKINQLASERANEVAKRVKEMNGDLEKAAKSMGLEVKTPAAFDRAASVEGLGSAAYLAEGFVKPVGTILGPTPVPDGRVIAKVVEHLPADISLLAAQRAGLEAELRGKKANERNDLFSAGLREELIKERLIKIHKKVVDQLIASYRG
jgi:peptidyl-prolyl cis-trans isomerase D